MSQNSKIEWCDHSYNPWWGCQKVSEGCRNCYAETFAKRVGQRVWGPPATTSRRMFGDKHWNEPLRWNADAEKAGTRARVFCASMADVFEDHQDVDEARQRLFRLVVATPWLDWLLLTKRPENINRMIPESWHVEAPRNWWMGTSTEDQQTADERIPHLLATPARVKFLSMEPLLGPVDLSITPPTFGAIPLNGATYEQRMGCLPKWQTRPMRARLTQGIDWAILGGESGAGFREMDVQWVADIVAQCKQAGVAVFVKQDSGRYPAGQGRIPDELFLHEFPVSPAEAGQ